MTQAQVLIATAIVFAFVNTAYVGLVGTRLRSDYPRADLPKAPILAWGTMIAGLAGLGVARLLATFGEPAAMAVALATLGWLMFLIDVRSHTLPNRLTALLSVEVFAIWFLFALRVGAVQDLWKPVLGAVIWAASLLPGWWARQVGLGDVKLAPALGFALGAFSVTTALVGLLVALLLAGANAAWSWLAGRSLGHRFALGPYLVVGSWVAVAAVALVHWAATA